MVAWSVDGSRRLRRSRGRRWRIYCKVAKLLVCVVCIVCVCVSASKFYGQQGPRIRMQSDLQNLGVSPLLGRALPKSSRSEHGELH